MGALTVAGPLRAQEDPWLLWCEAHLAVDGRVVDAPQGGISHSEGQAYGMLLATVAGDEPRFEAMRAWAESRLAARRDDLLAWRWVPGEPEAVRDYNNASDGDLFYAWALLRGARLWGRDDLADRAGRVAVALADICLAPDPRGEGEFLLPAAEGFRSDDGLILNPSYWMPRALHDLAAAFGLPRLAAAAESGASLLWEVASSGPVPDWLEVTATGWRPSPRHRPVSGFEAIRVPIWLVWSGRAGHPAVIRAQESAGPDGAFRIVDVGTGADAGAATEPGFAAVLRLAACAGEPIPAYASGQPYYPAVLHLLALAAASEGNRVCA